MVLIGLSLFLSGETFIGVWSGELSRKDILELITNHQILVLLYPADPIVLEYS